MLPFGAWSGARAAKKTTGADARSPTGQQVRHTRQRAHLPDRHSLRPYATPFVLTLWHVSALATAAPDTPGQWHSIERTRSVKHDPTSRSVTHGGRTWALSSNESAARHACARSVRAAAGIGRWRRARRGLDRRGCRSSPYTGARRCGHGIHNLAGARRRAVLASTTWSAWASRAIRFHFSMSLPWTQ